MTSGDWKTRPADANGAALPPSGEASRKNEKSVSGLPELLADLPNDWTVTWNECSRRVLT